MKNIKRGEKPTRHVVFIGHSDYGKSTLLGKKKLREDLRALGYM